MQLASEWQASRALLIAATSLLTACGGMTTSCEKPPPINPALTKPCAPIVYASDVGWEEAHRANTVTAANCRVQYQQLKRAISKKELEYE